MPSHNTYNSVELNQNEYIFPKRLIKKKKVYQILKRVVDIFGATTGLVILLPVFILISLVIKIENPRGSVFFVQTRVGKNGTHFKMYKYRSMILNAEELIEDLMINNEASGAMFKIKNDPRITKIGRFIRKTSLDELPQLWNVFIGDMSLVGPRPPLPREVTEYSTLHKQRLLVIPGCTGLWQISGRSNLGFEDMVRLDIEYIKQSSILYDFKIIIKTIFLLVRFKDNGAY